MTAASVIVPARNAAATIGRSLEALARQDLDRAFEVIVVDDGSEDETAAIAARADGPVRVVRQPHQGQAAARNRGAATAAGEVLAFTDADCFPRPGWLREGIAALERADLVQGVVRADPEAKRGPFDRTVEVGAEIGLYETANLLVRRSLFDQIGGFEDWLPVNGKQLAEDLWFGWRARRGGARITFSDRAVVDHAVFPRGALDYIAERSRLVYFPVIAAKMPELRKTFFFGRFWLTRRSAAFDLAALALAAAVRLRSPAPLVAALPYARSVARTAAPWGWPGAARVALAELAADAVGAGALITGSVKSRSPLV